MIMIMCEPQIEIIDMSHSLIQSSQLQQEVFLRKSSRLAAFFVLKFRQQEHRVRLHYRLFLIQSLHNISLYSHHVLKNFERLQLHMVIMSNILQACSAVFSQGSSKLLPLIGDETVRMQSNCYSRADSV